MAAKHDGKHARANMWVTHQNLAAQKGGYPGRLFKAKGAKKGPPAPKAKPLVATSGPGSTDAALAGVVGAEDVTLPAS